MKRNSLIIIKPCPFCGGNARLKKGFPSTQGKAASQALIQCEKCGCRTKIFARAPMEPQRDNELSCINTWNKRIYEDND